MLLGGFLLLFLHNYFFTIIFVFNWKIRYFACWILSLITASTEMWYPKIWIRCWDCLLLNGHLLYGSTPVGSYRNMGRRLSYTLCTFFFVAWKNCSHKNLVNLGQSSTHFGQNCPYFRCRDTIFLCGQFFTWPNQEYKFYVMSLIRTRGQKKCWMFSLPVLFFYTFQII